MSQNPSSQRVFVWFFILALALLAYLRERCGAAGFSPQAIESEQLTRCDAVARLSPACRLVVAAEPPIFALAATQRRAVSPLYMTQSRRATCYTRRCL